MFSVEKSDVKPQYHKSHKYNTFLVMTDSKQRLNIVVRENNKLSDEFDWLLNIY